MAKPTLNPGGEACEQAVSRLLRGVIVPTLLGMEAPYASPEAAALLAATAWTESLCHHRDQVELVNGKLVPGRPGPAYSLYQIEMPTWRKMTDPGGPEEWQGWREQLEPWGLLPWAGANPGMMLTCSEVGATIAARGLYWSDYWSRKRKLPGLVAFGDAACDYYEGTWRPAKAARPEGRKRFRAAWPVAVDVVRRAWPVAGA